jgi:hypothetical protein
LKNKILFAIIPLILSIGIVSVLPFVDADVSPDTLCREGYVVVHRFQQNDYACMSMELAKSWEAVKTGQIVNSEPIKQSSPPQISEDSQTTSMSDNPQMMEKPSAKQLKCDAGLNLVINGMDGSTACVRPSSVQKLIESGWISIGPVPVQEQKQEHETEPISSEPKVTTHLDFLPDDNDRAMYFVARFSEGLIAYTEVIKSSFVKFVPFEEYSFQIKPENPLPKQPPFKFLLETLPSKDNIGYYRAIDDYFQIDSALFKEFDVSIDVVSGDGTTLQTWEYRNCDLEDFSIYLQDNVLFDRFLGNAGPEIRERSIFHCTGFSLVAPEN